MAVTLNEWLRRARKDRAWYDSLPPQERSRVDASVRNTPANIQLQQLAINEPSDIARGIDKAVSEEQRVSGDIARATAAIAQNPEKAEQFDRFLSKAGYSREWFNTLPEDLKPDVVRAFEDSRESGQVTVVGPESNRYDVVKRAAQEAEKRAQGATKGTEEAFSGVSQPPKEAAPEQAQATAQASGPRTEGSPAKQVDRYPSFANAIPTDQETILAAKQGAYDPSTAYDPFALDTSFASSPFVLSGDTSGTVLPGRREFLDERVTGPEFQQHNAGAFINSFAVLSSAQISEWQARLEKAGLLGAGEYTPGHPDDRTLRAMQAAIVESQRQKESLFETLSRRAVGEKKREAAEKANASAEAKVSFQEMAQDRYKDQLLTTYMKLWGVAPPPGYIDAVAKEGVNWYEFDARERSKPAFVASPAYQAERISLEAQLAAEFGALG